MMANGIKTMLDTLRNKLEHLNVELDELDRVFTTFAKALQQDMPLTDGFIAARHAVWLKEKERENAIREIMLIDPTMFTEFPDSDWE